VLVVSRLFTSSAPVEDRFRDAGWTLGKQLQVVLEPLAKFLTPVVFLFPPGASIGVRVYLLAVILAALVIWSFVGGMITRLAAVELAGKDPLSLREAFRYVAGKYFTYLAAPALPLVGCVLIVVGQILFGLIHLIPWVGDVWDGLLYPLMLLAGIGMALILVGLV